uniref:Spindle assembly checkpoint kinase-like n=1 Tax=Gouania willdenowi TaxID=441366 RepID=A0A8C5GX51_GOUWI
MAYSTQTIAKGCFGKIYKQKYNDTWAAIKKVPQNFIDRKDLERECDVYNKAQHPNIVKLLGNITLTKGLWIIPLEFIFGEDLETTIFKSSRSKVKLTQENKATIIVGMCEGLYYLHCKDIVHQDLKPDNIMVEHATNRAVIIDLGLAKFFRCGQNSAKDGGNLAYGAPEVLQRGFQRDQRSDVWAVGKIIAELCARVRLHTPSVCPEKIKENLKDQPFCKAVCRMVDINPSLRASMGGIIHDIRSAGRKGIVASPPVKKDLLKPPSPTNYAINRSPSPMDRGGPRDPTPMPMDSSPIRRSPSPMPIDPSPIRGSPSPMPMVPSPIRRSPSPMPIDPSPIRGSPSPMPIVPSPIRRSPSPMPMDPSPISRSPSPIPMDPSPIRRSPSPLPINSSPIKRSPSPMPMGPSPIRRYPSPMPMDPSPTRRSPSPIPMDPSPIRGSPSPMHRASPQINKDPPPKQGSPSIFHWERTPRPDLKPLPTKAGLPPSPSLNKAEDKNKNQALAPIGGQDIIHDFMKMQLYKEATKDHPCNLPTTGRVVIRSFEEKNGEGVKWVQKEVVTQGGKIVKYNDISYNTN